MGSSLKLQLHVCNNPLSCMGGLVNFHMGRREESRDGKGSIL